MVVCYYIQYIFITSLCLKGQDFDMGLKQEIQYAPYLIFRQRLVSLF